MLLSSVIAAAAAFAAPAFGAPLGAETAGLEERGLAGINDWNCKCSNGKEPIVFLHGLGGPAVINWATKAPIFAADGHCVFTPQYGTKNGILLGFGSMRASSKEIAAYVQKVLASTGAEKVK